MSVDGCALQCRHDMRSHCTRVGCQGCMHMKEQRWSAAVACAYRAAESEGSKWLWGARRAGALRVRPAQQVEPRPSRVSRRPATTLRDVCARCSPVICQENFLTLAAASSHLLYNGHGAPGWPKRGRYGGPDGTLGSLRVQGVAENRSRAPGRARGGGNSNLRRGEGVKRPAWGIALRS